MLHSLYFTHLLVGKHTAGFFRQDLQSLDLLKDPNQDLEGFLQERACSSAVEKLEEQY